MKKIWIIGAAGLLVLFLVWSVVSIYPEWLWFTNLDFSPVFWTMLAAKFGFGFLIWFLLILIITINLVLARRLSPGPRPVMLFRDERGEASQMGLSGGTLNVLFMALILILSFVIASKGSANWDMVLRYLYQQDFGHGDPIFGRDVGFYVFSLPFWMMVRDGLMILFVFGGLITIVWYLKEGSLQIIGDVIQGEGKPPALPKIAVAPGVKKHLVFLAGIIVLLLAWGYYLKVFGLLYSTQGPAFGASYTDVHFRIWAYWALFFASLLFAVLLFVDLFRPRAKLLWISGGIWVGLILVLSNLLPMAVQKFVVKPNELAKETPYIAYNLDYTRKAYNLDDIDEVGFWVDNKLTEEEIKNEETTIQNIRIWDERPLLQTYRQIQSMRLYYDFNNVDVDRYHINRQYRQVMLSARELMINQLPPQANTWVNRHLIFTHGYGLVANPVNEVTSEGLPRLFIKDLPPSSDVGLQVDRPEIYYGEKTDQYVLVKTKTKEFDFPKGDKNVYTFYEGEGGVPITSFLRRLLFSIEFMDPQIFFTTYLTPESRIMYNRRIHKRVATIAPFLDYDRDPYLVLSGGKLYWILDAYATSDMYPYSQRSSAPFNNRRLNYIRNSVKVVVDAYHGKVSFYVIDDKDPIAKTYKKIFPDLFKPFKDMPEDLKKHVRYPKDLFDIQARTYTRYHMRDVQVFYNQEDLWQIPDELYGEQRQRMEPYYIIIKLPGEEKEEFLVILPFTPSKKDNMIGWLAARSDLPHYGTLAVFKLPKEKLVYGPMQIEARIDQQTEISREFSLWSQRGSRVIRGNLLAIPICNSFIYVEPIYLEAKQEEREPTAGAPAQRGIFGKSRTGGQAAYPGRQRPKTAALPELKRVIVALGNRLAMKETLDRAIFSVLGEEVALPRPTPSPTAPGGEETGLGARALKRYNEALDRLQQGDWAGYGKKLEELKGLLKEMAGKTENKE